MGGLNYIFDAANSFRSFGQAAITTTTAVGELPLDKLVSSREGSQRDKLGAQEYKLVVHVEGIDFVNVTDPGALPTPTVAEDYTFVVEVGAAGAASTPVGELKPLTAGTYVIQLDAASIEKLDPSRSVIELNVVAAGTAPSVSFAAWLL